MEKTIYVIIDNETKEIFNPSNNTSVPFDRVFTAMWTTRSRAEKAWENSCTSHNGYGSLIEKDRYTVTPVKMIMEVDDETQDT